MARPKKSNRSDDRFELKRVIGHKPDGSAIRRSFYGKNKEEAMRKYYDFCASREQAMFERMNTPFVEWVDVWLYTYKQPDVKPTTFITTYERPCNRYIKPYFKDKFLQEVAQADIKAFLNTLLTTCSQSLLEKIILCLRGIFECAIDNDRIQKNPCRNISAKSKKEKEQKRTYDRASAEWLCGAAHPYALYVHILLRMGLRCSELCGLKWGDIDFQKKTMSIGRALTTENGTIYIDATKSRNSTRKLDIPEDLFVRLQQHQGEDGEFVAVQNGRHVTPDHFGERQLAAFYSYLQIPKEKRLSPHELRHTCGTLLYQETKDIYHVSRFLGHSDIGITTKTYVHSSMQEDAVHLDIETPSLSSI